MTAVPPYLTPSEVGRACGMPGWKVKRLLRRIGIAEKHGGKWVVGESRLRERLPELYDRVFEHFELVDEIERNRTEPDEIEHSGSGS